jgi:hypothetical protein
MARGHTWPAHVQARAMEAAQTLNGHGGTPDAVAWEWGLPPASVRRAAAILKRGAVPAVVAAVRAQRVSLYNADLIAARPADEQEALLAEVIARGGASRPLLRPEAVKPRSPHRRVPRRSVEFRVENALSAISAGTEVLLAAVTEPGAAVASAAWRESALESLERLATAARHLVAARRAPVRVEREADDAGEEPNHGGDGGPSGDNEHE